MSTLLSSHLDSHVPKELMGVASDLTRRHNLTANSLTIFPAPSLQLSFPETLVWRYFVEVSVRAGLDNFAFSLVVAFYCGLHLLQRKVSLMRGWPLCLSVDIRTNV